MSKKDYLLLAKAIRDTRNTQADRDIPVVMSCALRIAGALASDNTRFSEPVFMRACGFGKRPDGTYEAIRD